MSDQVETFIKTLDKPEYVFNYAKYSHSIQHTICLTSLCQLAVSTDSSMMHVAESLSKPSFGIYGPFPGEIRLTTYKNADWINCEKDCAPCFLHGANECPNSKDGHSTCYDNLDIEETVKRIEGKLK